MSLAIVTGSSAGLGFQAARLLCQQGIERIVICSRDLERAKAAVIKLGSEFPDSEFIPGKLVLNDLAEVTEFAERFKARFGSWDLLINNAGAKIESPTKSTAQGFEWHYGVNHLAHFLLTLKLAESAQTGSKVVTVSSIVARKGNPNLWLDAHQASAGEQYAASKLANLCFGLELDHRLKLRSSIAHPGFARAEKYGNTAVRLAEYALAQSAQAGARSIVSAALQAEKSYLGPRVLELWGSPKMLKIPKSASGSISKQLWRLSLQQLEGWI